MSVFEYDLEFVPVVANVTVNCFLSCRYIQEGGGSAATTGPSNQRPRGDLCQQVQN